MAWKGQAEFVSQDLKPWKSTVGGEEKVVGKWKEAKVKMVNGDEKTTRFTLVTIDGSGHMVRLSIRSFLYRIWLMADGWQVPQDQPEVALNMLHKWLFGESFD